MADSIESMQYWQGYHLVFQVLSPLHIGYRITENIQYTRRYVPAKTIWGALTAAISRSRSNQGYSQLVDDLKTHLRFTYFYLCEHDACEPFLPQYTDTLRFGEYTSIEFEKRFLDSYASTAVEPEYHAAQEGSLHEVEILTNYCKVEYHSPTFLTGYVFEHLDHNASEWAARLQQYAWQTYIRDIQVGGERKYGFGKLRLLTITPVPSNTKLFGYYKTTLDDQQFPILSISKTDPFPGHVLFDEKLIKIPPLQGETEVLVSRETLQLDKWGGHVTEPLQCFCPGCRGFEGKLKISEKFIMEILNKK